MMSDSYGETATPPQNHDIARQKRDQQALSALGETLSTASGRAALWYVLECLRPFRSPLLLSDGSLASDREAAFNGGAHAAGLSLVAVLRTADQGGYDLMEREAHEREILAADAGAVSADRAEQ